MTDPSDEEIISTPPNKPKPEIRIVAAPVKPLPWSEDAETNTIACVLMDGDDRNANGQLTWPTLSRCQEFNLSATSFYKPENRALFSVIEKLRSENLPTSIDLVAQAMIDSGVSDKIGGMNYLIDVTSKNPTTTHAQYFIDRVVQDSNKRAIIKGLSSVVEHAHNGDSMDEVVKAAKDVIADLKWEPADNIEDLLYDPSKDIEKPTPIYSAAGTTICTPGNLTTFLSQAKAGKTAIIGAMIAAACDIEGSANDTLGFRGVNTKGHAVLCFDTEQSRYDWQQMIKTAMRRVHATTPPKWLLCYHLTGKTADQAKKIIDRVIVKAAAKFGGIFAIFIDGIGDLCLDVNDSAESNNLVSHLHATAITYNCAIINVLHMNAGSENEKGRGHLGSQLERKSESNITLEKVDDVTSYWGLRQRGKMIPKAGAPSFKWCEDKHMHVSCESVETKKRGPKKTKFLEDYLSVFETIEGKAVPFPIIHRKADAKYPISRDTFWGLITSGVGTGEIQVNRTNPNEPRYWTTRV